MAARSYLIWLPVFMVGVLLPLSIFFTNYNQRIIDYNHQLQTDAERIRSNVSELFWGTIQAIDLGLRGYALIPEERFLDPMSIALSSKDSVFIVVAEDLRRQGFDLAQLSKFTDSLDAYIAFVGKMKLHLDSGNRQQFIAMLNQDKGYPLWHQYTEFSRQVDAFEDQIMLAAEQRHNAAMRNLYFVQIALLLVLTPTMALYVYHFRKSLRVSEDLVSAEAANARLAHKQNEELEASVRERTEALRMQMEIITSQHDQLQAANDSKDKIFSILSHDLRGPLANLQTTLVAFRNKILTAEDSVRVLNQLEESFEKTNELLNNLLIWSKSQLSGIKLDKKKFNLSDSLNTLSELFYETSKTKGIVIENASVSDVEVVAGKEMIEMVLRNLISNALKFTPEGGKITVKAYAKDAAAVVEISDSGVGMRKETIEKILMKGLAVSTLGTNKEKGTGMGLLLVREFIKLHNGAFDIDSEEGKGTTFRISIPR